MDLPDGGGYDGTGSQSVCILQEQRLSLQGRLFGTVSTGSQNYSLTLRLDLAAVVSIKFSGDV